MRYFALIALCLMALLAFTMAEEEFCACARILDPVCGSDSITYPNSCELKCAAKRFARQGRSLNQARMGSC